MLKITYSVLFVLTVQFVSFLWAHDNKYEKIIKKSEMSHWTAPADEKKRINPVADTIDSIQRGRHLYLNNCVDCHGPDAEGDGPDAENLEPKPTNLKAMAGHHPDGGMAWKIENGKDAMPAWKNIFTKQQTWDLVNFIQSLKKKK